MARIFKHTYTKPLPEGAELFTRKGKRHARFKDSKGKTAAAPLSKDGKKVIVDTAKWYIEYMDANGKRCRVPGYTDRKATEQKATELERTAERVRSGYRPKEHDELAKPLAEHLTDFKASLLAKGTSPKQAQQVHNRVKRILEGCRFVLWSDLSASKLQSFLADLRQDKEDKKGMSAQTSNWYLQAAKAFCSWMLKEGRAPENPLAYLQGLNVKVDRRHERRALTDGECIALLDAASTGSIRFGMPGQDRALLYLTAVESGLRAKELHTLTVGACHLEDSPPVLIVKAAYSKHRREDVQPIPPTLAAGIPYRDSSERVADFHSLRHTYVTNLARGGVHPKVAMDLARHSDINLTMARYSHTLVADRASALSALPSLAGRPGESSQPMRKTGTYANAVGKSALSASTTSTATSNDLDSCNSLAKQELRGTQDGLLNRRTVNKLYRGFESRPLRCPRKGLYKLLNLGGLCCFLDG